MAGTHPGFDEQYNPAKAYGMGGGLLNKTHKALNSVLGQQPPDFAAAMQGHISGSSTPPPLQIGIAVIVEDGFGDDCTQEQHAAFYTTKAPCRSKGRYITQFRYFEWYDDKWESRESLLELDAGGYWEPETTEASATPASKQDHGAIPQYRIGDAVSAYWDEVRGTLVPMEGTFQDPQTYEYYSNTEEVISTDVADNPDDIKGIVVYVELKETPASAWIAMERISFAAYGTITENLHASASCFIQIAAPHRALIRLRAVNTSNYELTCVGKRMRLTGVARFGITSRTTSGGIALGDSVSRPVTGGAPLVHWLWPLITEGRFKDSPRFKTRRNVLDDEDGEIEVTYDDETDQWIIGIEAEVTLHLEGKPETSGNDYCCIEVVTDVVCDEISGLVTEVCYSTLCFLVPSFVTNCEPLQDCVPCAYAPGGHVESESSYSSQSLSSQSTQSSQSSLGETSSSCSSQSPSSQSFSSSSSSSCSSTSSSSSSCSSCSCSSQTMSESSISATSESCSCSCSCSCSSQSLSSESCSSCSCSCSSTSSSSSCSCSCSCSSISASSESSPSSASSTSTSESSSSCSCSCSSISASSESSVSSISSVSSESCSSCSSSCSSTSSSSCSCSCSSISASSVSSQSSESSVSSESSESCTSESCSCSCSSQSPSSESCSSPSSLSSESCSCSCSSVSASSQSSESSVSSVSSESSQSSESSESCSSCSCSSQSPSSESSTSTSCSCSTESSESCSSCSCSCSCLSESSESCSCSCSSCSCSSQSPSSQSTGGGASCPGCSGGTPASLTVEFSGILDNDLLESCPNCESGAVNSSHTLTQSALDPCLYHKEFDDGVSLEYSITAYIGCSSPVSYGCDSGECFIFVELIVGGNRTGCYPGPFPPNPPYSGGHMQWVACNATEWDCNSINEWGSWFSDDYPAPAYGCDSSSASCHITST